ncbi:hypothetical protein [Paenibacillus phytohabitans]|uniref:hypothetical protein n=1 Tax=Paenibacillus phytohabitans TaxID=2654978 RepID=UPI0030097D09
MWEQLAGLSIKTLSWGGLIAFLAALIPVVKKIQPITTLTSSNFERTLLTKEKRMLVKLFRFIIQSIIYMAVIEFLLYCFYGLYSNTYFEIPKKIMIVLPNVFSYILVISSMILINTSISEKSLIERITSNKKIHAITFLILLSVFILSATLFIPLLFAPLLINGGIKYSNNSELFAVFLVFVMIFFVYSIVIMGGMKFSLTQFEKKRNMESGDYFYIQENDTSEKWYVYYPTSDDLYLLGDTPSTKETNVFKTMAKKELLTQKIHVQRLQEETE